MSNLSTGYLIQFIPNAKTKLYLYEGSYRLICGSNPLTAQAFFERALRKRRNGGGHMICSTDTERNPMSLSDTSDIASALLLMGKHTPSHISHPAEREGLIRESYALRGRQHSSDKKLML